MRIRRFLLPAIGLMAAIPALAVSDAPAPLSAAAQKELQGRTAGEPVSCVQLRQIQGTRIIDETAIIYRRSSRLWYVNQPGQGRCTLLRPTRVLITKNSGQMCNGETVTIAALKTFETFGGCELGRFVPYTK